LACSGNSKRTPAGSASDLAPSSADSRRIGDTETQDPGKKKDVPAEASRSLLGENGRDSSPIESSSY
jgi:hypothetical protein